MNVTVLFFAQARELAGCARCQLPLDPGATVQDVRRAVGGRFPDLSALLPHCLFSVDQRYAGDEDTIEADCEIGCIPPVSGG